ncbi:hypothetical protein SUGI_0703930 [Cryptomeria japonica]|nr:hypothetical protein SUGI_0703930 [Cryptomeria japonica]
MTQLNIPYSEGSKGFVEFQREGNVGAETWLSQVQSRFKSGQFKMLQPSPNVSIYKVPESMKASKREAYVPLIASFGFYHHHKGQNLSVMDDHKLEAVERTLKRLNVSKDQSNNNRISAPTAELLRNVGISFKPSADGKLRFDNRRFTGSYFVLPKIIVGDDTETILRNLIAYDECQRYRPSPEATIISQYISIIVDLIESEKDVSLLREQEIIECQMGRDNEIGDMFHNLDKEVTIQNIEQFQEVVKQTTDHYHSVLNLWIREFKEEYYSRPWYFVSLLMALFVLGMTAAQTYYGSKV